MATLRTSLVEDASSFANFKSISAFISGALSTFGWIQTTDIGQVQWNTITCNITNAVANGVNATYTYNTATSPLRNGMSITVTGCTTAAFNITGNIINLTGTTFQLALASTIAPEAETATGTVAALIATPGLNAFVYEVWKAGDSLATTYPLFIKMEYGQGNVGGRYNLAFTLGTGSTGLGNLTGAGTRKNYTSFNSPSTTITYDCLFSGDPARFNMMLWRDNPSNDSVYIGVERSKDSNGNDNGDFIYWHSTSETNNGTTAFNSQAIMSTGSIGTARTALETHNNNDATTLLQGTVAVFAPRPVLGYERNPLLSAFRGATNDFQETDTPLLSAYPGVSHIYFCTRRGGIGNWFGPINGGNNVLLMRFD